MNDNLMLVAFAQERAARLLSNYLLSLNIQAQYVYKDGQHPHVIELLDGSQIERAKELTEEFIANPLDQKYQQAAWQTGDSVNLQSRSKFSPELVLSQISGSPITSLVLLICIIVHGLALLGWQEAIFGFLQIQPLPVLLENHQWWRLLGPAFMHFTALHIIFNLLWWWVLGSQIELKLGSSTVVILFLITALASNIGQLLISGPYFGGLSGVVYGLVGFVWWTGWLRPAWGLSLPKAMIGFLLVWLVLGYADLLWVSMANTAHTVGLLSGCALAWIYTRLLK
jgi:GlpG protein